MAIASPFESIPSQFHLAACFLVGLAGFLIVIGFSSAKAPKETTAVKEVTIKDEATVVDDDASEAPVDPSTPLKSTPTSTPKKSTPSAYGSVATPGGRRSARIASKSAQKK
ncbi:predicted protein [Chaetoceros tenuissimus]|uniref:Transmembrane protein n=1 Tax=Chaetoceros tenuissimus TaxID=426638 RepID=A0AAD3CKT8_9STRA|nr:predicted protein [Chaetoceros tenuissimus]